MPWKYSFPHKIITKQNVSIASLSSLWISYLCFNDFSGKHLLSVLFVVSSIINTDIYKISKS